MLMPNAKRIMRSALSYCLLTAMFICLTGCYEERVISDTWGGFRDMSDKPAPTRDASRRSTRDLLNPPANARRSFTFAIPLVTFDGPMQQPDADEYTRMLRREYNLVDLWSRRDQDQTTVYRGQYTSADDKLAKSALRQMRMLRVNEELPFRNTNIKRIAMAQNVALGEMDLKGYASRGFYSLQVEVYDDAIGPEYQKTAESRAEALRQEGEPAYYYHGPHRSMVLIGLLTEDEAFVTHIGGAARYSPDVKELQERFPYNLYNGRTMIEKSGGKRVGEQPSFLVPVN